MIKRGILFVGLTLILFFILLASLVRAEYPWSMISGNRSDGTKNGNLAPVVEKKQEAELLETKQQEVGAERGFLQ